MNLLSPDHAPLQQFPVQDDCLQIGGIALTRLAQRVGSTPFYAYDRQQISERVQIKSFNGQGVPLYRVRVGPLASAEAGQRITQRLLSMGYRDTQLITEQHTN